MGCYWLYHSKLVAGLGYAREALGVKEVRTHHLTKNWPILAIDRALGYAALEGV